ncbi:Bcl-2-like protein 13 [Heterocephalus glaber]|uniref:Bcl-2-like protein 13 n=1 Tax=Heterocephalus glaber TaxID=10181 RepID=G5BPX4_HETGA|nr:Bcl-2-like protein 13 [Heterocephalus glaber]
MLLELTRCGQEPLSALLQYGVTYLEDHAAEYIIQQGGWGTVFSLESKEEEYPGIAAEDSNDIYILPRDNSGQVSPPESPTVTTSWQSESLPVSMSASQSWHTESLPVSLSPESWQQIAMKKSKAWIATELERRRREPDSEVITVEEVSPVPSLLVELSEEEVRAATMEPHEVDEGVPPSLLREKEAPVRKERLSRECPPAQEVKALAVPEG